MPRARKRKEKKRTRFLAHAQNWEKQHKTVRATRLWENAHRKQFASESMYLQTAVKGLVVPVIRSAYGAGHVECTNLSPENRRIATSRIKTLLGRLGRVLFLGDHAAHRTANATPQHKLSSIATCDIHDQLGKPSCGNNRFPSSWSVSTFARKTLWPVVLTTTRKLTHRVLRLQHCWTGSDGTKHLPH